MPNIMKTMSQKNIAMSCFCYAVVEEIPWSSKSKGDFKAARQIPHLLQVKVTYKYEKKANKRTQ